VIKLVIFGEEKRRELFWLKEISFFPLWILGLNGVCRIPDFIRKLELKQNRPYVQLNEPFGAHFQKHLLLKHL